MFKFFKKKTQKDEQESEELASIKFYLDKDDVPKISVNISSYEDEHIYSLARLINLLGKETLQQETLSIIEGFFKEHESESVFEAILQTTVMNSINQEQTSEDPYIKPSELMK